MSLIFIVPEDGSLEAQEQNYLRVKKSENIQLTLEFFKDRFRVYPWDLSNAGVLNFFAKKLKTDTTYVIQKDKNSPDWDKTDADSGILGINLNLSDVAARIVGDHNTFTGIAGDKIKVIVDSAVYDDIDVSACNTIAQVVTAINTAVGSVVASVDADGDLVITSPTTGTVSNITIADGTTTAHTCIDRLFHATPKTDVGRAGDLASAGSLYCEVEFQPNGSTRSYRTGDLVLDVVEDVES